ncbi:CPBP family intramembrane glutamic endopeptidase [Microbacterium aerolatum]|uniref:Abortive infection protein n=1 Tax=Microbacterium aerolatum TaxID=153731 RepID=A0A511AHW5_9MICO|nr:CPBP family intramembrane glutamic endopeptidase [Microbacterium aerolatum]GEK87562.1 abortive infection protein [Microbacterium aerolatum]GGB14482.1 abortive infection protein [Microbacterium aerolatum]
MTRIRPAATISFIVLAMGLAWLVTLPLWGSGGVASPLFGVLVPVMMFTPTIAAIIVMLALRPVPKGQWLRFLGMWPLRPAKRVVWMTIIGLFAPFVLVVASVFVAALCGWVQLDLVNFSGFAQTLAATMPEGTPMPPAIIVIVSQLVMIPIAAATVNAVVAFGEELGWRGFLVPALRPLGTWPALLISSAIWGLWHAPIILLGYNFARYDITGVLLMTAGCIAWGVLLGWLRLRSASVWPAVFAHGMMNACAALVGLVYAAGTTFDMALAGPLGVAGWIVCAAVVVVLALTGQFRRQPELDGAPGRLLSAPRG